MPDKVPLFVLRLMEKYYSKLSGFFIGKVHFLMNLKYVVVRDKGHTICCFM